MLLSKIFHAKLVNNFFLKKVRQWWRILQIFQIQIPLPKKKKNRTNACVYIYIHVIYRKVTDLEFLKITKHELIDKTEQNQLYEKLSFVVKRKKKAL